MTTSRTRFTSTGFNSCTLTWQDDMTGTPITRHFWSFGGGSCVREERGAQHGTLGQQVCGGLRWRGPTLIWSGDEPLIALIRREHRSNRRAQT